jgi:hypothetical protein
MINSGNNKNITGRDSVYASTDNINMFYMVRLFRY